MTASTLPEPLEAQQTGVQVDFRDPNHPHFPGDLESQPISRPFLRKKARWTTGAAIMIIIALVTAILVGGKLGMDSAQKPVPSPVTTTISAESKTVYMTTIEISTSVYIHSITPSATTITTTTTLPTPTPTPSELPGDDGTGAQRKKCVTYGTWGTMEECLARCPSDDLSKIMFGDSQCRDRSGTVHCLMCREA